MKVYKLTDDLGKTIGDTQWGENITHDVKHIDPDAPLCTKHWLHSYEHPLLAVLHNPIHAAYRTPLLWEAEASGIIKRDGQMKLGSTILTTLKQIEVPKVSIVQHIAYGILAARSVSIDPAWVAWAEGWLQGVNRDTKDARDAAWAARATGWIAWVVACVAARVAAGAAPGDAWDADAAQEATQVAAQVAAIVNLNLILLAKEAMTIK